MDQYKDITKSLELVYENQARRELMDLLIQEGYDVEGITVDNVFEYCIENNIDENWIGRQIGKAGRGLKGAAEWLTGFGAKPKAVINPTTKGTTIVPSGGKRRALVIGGTGTAAGMSAPETMKGIGGNVIQRTGGAIKAFVKDPAEREKEENKNEIIRLQKELERRQKLKNGGNNNKNSDNIKGIFDFKDSTDLFDIVKGHLVSEGYAKDEKAAIVIMANMSEEWRKSILKNTGV